MLRGEYAFATGYMEQISGAGYPQNVLGRWNVPQSDQRRCAGFCKKSYVQRMCIDCQYPLGRGGAREIIPSHNGNGLFEWNSEALPAGVYLLQLHDAAGKVIAVDKLIKQ